LSDLNDKPHLQVLGHNHYHKRGSGNRVMMVQPLHLEWTKFQNQILVDQIMVIWSLHLLWNKCHYMFMLA